MLELTAMCRPAAYTFVIALVATLAIHVQPVADAQSIGTRVLLITGGHSYDRDALLQVFRANAEISFTHIEHSEGTADGDFAIHDEVYSGYRLSPDATPLVRTSHPDSGSALLWVRTEGRSRVVYYLLGHGPSAFSNASYRALLANCIRWAARTR